MIKANKKLIKNISGYQMTSVIGTNKNKDMIVILTENSSHTAFYHIVKCVNENIHPE